MSALSPPSPARGGAGHDSTLRQCIALGNVGTCMETADISAYVHKFESYTDVYKEMRLMWGLKNQVVAVNLAENVSIGERAAQM